MLQRSPLVLLVASALALALGEGCAIAAPCSSSAECPEGAACSEGVCSERGGLDDGATIAGREHADDTGAPLQRERARDGEGAQDDDGAVALDETGSADVELAVDRCPGGTDRDGDGRGPGCSLGNDCDDANALVVEGCGACLTRMVGERAFTICNDDKDHDPSRSDCLARGMDLASIHSADEATAVQQLVAEADAGDRVWIGLEERGDAAAWSDGSPFDFFDYQNSPSQTIGEQGHEHCGVVSGDHWNDDDCSGHSFPRLCATRP